MHRCYTETSFHRSLRYRHHSYRKSAIIRQFLRLPVQNTPGFVTSCSRSRRCRGRGGRRDTLRSPTRSPPPAGTGFTCCHSIFVLRSAPARRKRKRRWKAEGPQPRSPAANPAHRGALPSLVPRSRRPPTAGSGGRGDTREEKTRTRRRKRKDRHVPIPTPFPHRSFSPRRSFTSQRPRKP